MTSYSALEIFPLRALDYRQDAEKIVRNLPNVYNDKLLRCHEVARIVGNMLQIAVHDGVYGAVDHSWCSLHFGKDHFILDPYAVGRLSQVQLIAQVPGFGYGPYVPREARTDIDEAMVKHFCDPVKLGLCG